MNSNIISLILGVGAGAVAYSLIGKRIGYSNTKRIWILCGSVFALVYVIVLLTMTQVVHFK